MIRLEHYQCNDDKTVTHVRSFPARIQIISSTYYDREYCHEVSNLGLRV